MKTTLTDEPPVTMRDDMTRVSCSLRVAYVWLIAFVVGLAFAGCATAPRESERAKPADDSNYPYSEIERIYDTVLTTMVPRFYESGTVEAAQHTQALEAFVRTTCTKQHFVELMVSNETRALFDRAREDPTVRDTKEFKQRFEVTVSVSVQMAMIMFAGRFDVYNRKCAYPDDLLRELFQIASTPEEEEFVAWVSGEATVEDARKELGENTDIREGDRFFAFSSPDWYWEQLAGRQGYLQVRDDKIVDVHVTLLN